MCTHIHTPNDVLKVINEVKKNVSFCIDENNETYGLHCRCLLKFV